MSSKWKERNVKTRKDRKYVGENPCQSEEGALVWDRQLCSRFLDGQQKSGISDSRRSPNPNSWEKNSWGVRGGEDEEEEPATERRREYPGLEIDLEEREVSMSPAMSQPWLW